MLEARLLTLVSSSPHEKAKCRARVEPRLQSHGKKGIVAKAEQLAMECGIGSKKTGEIALRHDVTMNRLRRLEIGEIRRG